MLKIIPKNLDLAYLEQICRKSDLAVQTWPGSDQLSGSWRVFLWHNTVTTCVNQANPRSPHKRSQSQRHLLGYAPLLGQQPRDGRFGSKVGQIGPKWDKSGAFSDQISVHLARGAKCTEI